MYHSDLEKVENETNSYYVGWLDSNHDFPQGDVPSNFLSRLWMFCNVRLFQSKGFHSCELCHDAVYGVVEDFYGHKISLGSAEVRVFGKNNKIYASPDMIYHYIVKHNYCPTSEFVEIVLACPLLDSDEYIDLIKLHSFW